MYWVMNNVKSIVIGLVSVALFSAGWFGNGWRWEAKYKELTLRYQESALKAEKQARVKEQALQTAIDEERKTKDEKIRTINAKLDTALDELRQRPSRESNSKGSCDCKGADGTKLFREDGQFLKREAARADKAVVELKACYAAYDAVREQINKE